MRSAKSRRPYKYEAWALDALPHAGRDFALGASAVVLGGAASFVLPSALAYIVMSMTGAHTADVPRWLGLAAVVLLVLPGLALLIRTFAVRWILLGVTVTSRDGRVRSL